MIFVGLRYRCNSNRIKRLYIIKYLGNLKLVAYVRALTSRKNSTYSRIADYVIGINTIFKVR